MDHVQYDFMAGMDEEAVTRRLAEHGTGVLALARDGDAYAIPVSYAYEDGSLYVRLLEDEDSKKFHYLQSTGEASLVVHAVTDEAAWSVVATGPLRELTGERRAAFDDAAINERFGPMHVFDQAVDDLAVRIYELEVAVPTGRTTAP